MSQIRMVDGHPNTDRIVGIWVEMHGKCIKCGWRIDVTHVTYGRRLDGTRQYCQRERSGCRCEGRRLDGTRQYCQRERSGCRCEGRHTVAR